MFIFKKLHLENFMSLTSVDMDFNDVQMSAITGNNGEGKSAIVTSMAFTLFNYRKGESYKDYVKIGTEKAVIHLDAYFKGKPIVYDVEIYSGTLGSHKTSPVSRAVVYDGKTYYNSEYNQFLETHNITETDALMFMYQGSNDLIKCRPKERANMLKKMFDTQFPDIIEKLNTQKDNEQRLTIEYDTRIDELNKKSFEMLPALRGVPEEGIIEMENRVKEIDETLNKMGIANEDEISKCESDIASLQRTLNTLKSNMANDKASLDKMSTQLKDIIAKIGSMDSNLINSEISRINREIEAHDIQYQKDKESYLKLTGDLNLIKFRLKEMREHYDVSKTGVCHSCGQPIEESYVRSLEESISRIEIEEKNKSKELTELGFDSRDSKGKKLKEELNFNERKLTELENLISSESVYREKIDTTLKLIEERESTLKELESKMDILQEKRKELEEAVRLVEKRKALNDEKSQIQTQIKENRERSARNIERALANRKTAEAMEERDEQVRKLMEKNNGIIMSMNKTKQELNIFSNEFPTFIVIKCCERIEDFINEIVQKVFPYCRVSLQPERSGVNFVYTAESSSDSTEEWLPVSMASGAQGTILTLAYFLALAKFSGVSSVFLDEIDASCSPENSEIIYNFIAELDCFPQIFFISHRPEAHEVVKSKNESLITYRVMQGSVMEEG